jgi:hypothetical protein
MTYQPYPSAPPPPPPPPRPADPLPPSALRPVIALLLVNLGLSIAVTIAVFATKNSLINYQLDHRHITNATKRLELRDSYSAAIWARAAGNVVVSVIYTFLVRALLRGRRWAYRRVIVLSIAGIVALALLWLTPYPVWMRVEQIGQSLVLAGLLYFVTRPAVRSHFAGSTAGRSGFLGFGGR